MTQPDQPSLEDLARELDVVATWNSGARGQKVTQLADALWQHAGGRPTAQAGDANLATPGPGVRAKTALDVEGDAPVAIESHGQIADAKVPPTPPAGQTPEHVAKTQREQKPPQ